MHELLVASKQADSHFGEVSPYVFCGLGFMLTLFLEKVPSSASLGFTDSSQVEVLIFHCKSVSFRSEQSLNSPTW